MLKQWLLIGLGLLVFMPALTILCIVKGYWLPLALLWGATLVSAAQAWRAGLPLWPGREPRTRDKA